MDSTYKPVAARKKIFGGAHSGVIRDA